MVRGKKDSNKRNKCVKTFLFCIYLRWELEVEGVEWRSERERMGRRWKRMWKWRLSPSGCLDEYWSFMQVVFIDSVQLLEYMKISMERIVQRMIYDFVCWKRLSPSSFVLPPLSSLSLVHTTSPHLSIQLTSFSNHLNEFKATTSLMIVVWYSTEVEPLLHTCS